MPTGPRMPPTPTPAQSQRTALRERVDSLTALTEQNANLRAELEALQFSNRVGALRVKVETIALKSGIADGPDLAPRSTTAAGSARAGRGERYCRPPARRAGAARPWAPACRAGFARSRGISRGTKKVWPVGPEHRQSR